MAHRRTAPFAPMNIVSDSKYVVNGLTEHLPGWERRGWIGVANATIIKEVVSLLRSRSAPTTFKWVKGHSGVRGNEEADRLAGEGAACPPPARPLHLPAPERYMVRGASLPHLTQRLAYQGIQEWNAKDDRPATLRNLLTVQRDLERAFGVRAPEQMVWNLLRRNPISRKARDFTWKALHEGHRVGKYWAHIPGYEDRAICPVCGVTETMEHILCQCEAPGQRVAWALARGILSKKSLNLPELTLGLALGGHAVAALTAEGAARPGATRLARIILTETAYLIWVLRCDRVVGGRVPLPLREEEGYVENRWMRVITGRLNTDCTLASKRVAGKWAVPPSTVLKTWEKTLHEEDRLPSDWTKSPGVLVGRPLQTYVPAGD
ncbi:RnaseH-domain-containing protein [Trametes versicolor FP-101664 SS1]|uniref:RnaseH-domain-containing protein n=1 Tax=Trametes versicolor (strain FP-101664) TaxID=717944 RepID=UPI0004621E5E|nr:RnaseH-domain-containing protein [Trametes versicolor FP-101664 SS1]EIW54950.1 RnaseH-domain-containing protein [Trametes versicolor FP-101664 SS1]